MDSKINDLMNYDYAIHSDFLIHWTGRDIDSECDPKWFQSDRSTTSEIATEKYFKRLVDILQYGIWMSSEKDSTLRINDSQIEIPPTPISCFTELKLSESRLHARSYGRLGIGFKRPFLFNRFGRPVIYYGYHKNDIKDIFLQQACAELSDKRSLNFFKPMNSSSKLVYDFFRESEWRIIYLEELKKNGFIIDPRDPKNKKEYNYFKQLTSKEQDKLEFLLPLDKWFSMIIYPSHDVRNKVQNDSSNIIAQAMKIIKSRPDNGIESKNWPIELYIDACRNF
jgi:hypothetical protein